MTGEAYELLAMLMRYIFVVMGALILWRAYRWLRRDARAYRKEMRSLPDAGLVGEIVDLKTGKSQPLPREGIMGSARECDIRVQGAGVKRRHAMFAFEEGKGLQVTPYRGSPVLMAGIELQGPAHALHGTQLQLGDAILRVRLFAGLKVPNPSQFQEDFAGDLPETDMETWEMEDVPAPFAPVDMAQPIFREQDENPAYAGGYTEDGQMTWQYAAYPLEELYQAQEAQQREASGEDEALPYESPVPRRRRRNRR